MMSETDERLARLELVLRAYMNISQIDLNAWNNYQDDREVVKIWMREMDNRPPEPAIAD